MVRIFQISFNYCKFIYTFLIHFFSQIVENFKITDDEKKKHALVDIDRILRRNGSSLRNFETMSFPDDYSDVIDYNRFIHDEMQ